MDASKEGQRCYRIPGERRPNPVSCAPTLPKPAPHRDAEKTVHTWIIYWMATIPGEERSLRWMARQIGVSRSTVARGWESFEARMQPSEELR